MFRLTIHETFAAAHHLEHYEGDCAKEHGHTWKVAAQFRFRGKLKHGMSVDFKELKAVLRKHCAELDHSNLNEILGVEDPTAEVIAQRLYFKLQGECASFAHLGIAKVIVWESDTASATFSEEANI